MANPPGNLLCVSNFPSSTGYAWDFICGLYARVADHLAGHNIQTFVAYPSMPIPPRALEGSAAWAIVLDTTLASSQSVQETTCFIRRENIRAVYFTDRPARHGKYLNLRWAGVRRIVVHDHASGEQTRPRGIKRPAKWLLARTPGIVADAVITVSKYVARRQIEVGLIPPDRVHTVWNGIPLPERNANRVTAISTALGIPAGRTLVVCACRAAPDKGVAHLLRAFDRVAGNSQRKGHPPVLLFLGDGPQMQELRSLRESLASKHGIFLPGYRPDAREILQSADVCVIPSVWQDAFPLAVMEAMALAKPVIATSVGGIPEMIENRVHGLLVPPGDESALATALDEVMDNPEVAMRFGEAARIRVSECFTPEQQIRKILALLEGGLGGPCEAVRS